ncbi:MAG: 1-deoxy-D-xylulose-5-phosphate reductoisomerase [Gemmatimonadetes bacterium]|nr:1-deoxy-D-xylulose-5-phosphate reductoisomerase [Gemmatimonadota bacterium]
MRGQGLVSASARARRPTRSDGLIAVVHSGGVRLSSDVPVKPPRRVVVLGATGSIGSSTLKVVARHVDRFRIAALTAGRQAEALDRLAACWDPDYVVLADGADRPQGDQWNGQWRYGRDEVKRAAADPSIPIVVNALVGFAGLESTLAALEAGKRLALANKESLVVGGELVLEAAAAGGGELLPVDSEHSAILQCLGDRPTAEVSRVILTASGGPFRDWPADRFAAIRPEDALAHPTWSMGDKISVDSATLANKALEVIEAHLLFGLDFDRIDVVVHPASIVHSMVEFRDGSTVSQLGYPTMEVPILFALSAPERLSNEFRAFDPVGASPLEFERLRREDFPMFELGVAAGRSGGTAPAVYNAANEVAVRAFLSGRLSFSGIPKLVEMALSTMPATPVESLEHLVSVDAEARSRSIESVGTQPATGGEKTP